jgi:hypothetical protein
MFFCFFSGDGEESPEFHYIPVRLGETVRLTLTEQIHSPGLNVNDRTRKNKDQGEKEEISMVL